MRATTGTNCVGSLLLGIPPGKHAHRTMGVLQEAQNSVKPFGIIPDTLPTLRAECGASGTDPTTRDELLTLTRRA